MDEDLSIQGRLYPQLTCFGCGHANPAGLRLRSYPGKGGVTATFLPRPEHDNGLGYLNSGIIPTVLEAHRRGWASPEGPALPYVTAGLDVRYLRPTPLAEPLVLVTRVTTAAEHEMTAEVKIRWDGKPRAAAVARWRRWRPPPSLTHTRARTGRRRPWMSRWRSRRGRCLTPQIPDRARR